LHHKSGSSSPGRATASQAVGSGFESRLPLLIYTMEKKNFFVTLTPPRVTFISDMTDEERQVMNAHVAYWRTLLDRGIAIAYGPVMDPKGAFGIGVVEVDDLEQLKEIVAADPSNGLQKFEIFPMRAVYKKSI
jgi:uncharacterized protein